MINFAFYVSGNATTLKNFIEKYSDSILLSQIKIVISDNLNDKELESFFKKLEAEVLYFDSSMYEKSQINIELSNFILDNFEKYKIDFGFVFGGRILKGLLLNKYKNKLINFHPALLPSFKGIKAIDQALKANAFLLGNSAHIVVEDVDSGAVIMQNILHRSNFNNYCDVINNQINMLYQIILWINDNRMLIFDDIVIIKNATYNIEDYIPNLEFVKKKKGK